MISITLLSIKDDTNKIIEADNLHPDFLHIDVMDGKFVNNHVEMETLPDLKTKREVHLMVYDVKSYVDYYRKYQPEYITFHYEATPNVSDTIAYIKSLGIKAGLAISPNTDVQEIIPFLKDVDLVLVMGVEPGQGGQAFIENTTNKINDLHTLREKDNYHYLIEVDGGINNQTKSKCLKADILAVGSYITLSDNYAETMRQMLL